MTSLMLMAEKCGSDTPSHTVENVSVDARFVNNVLQMTKFSPSANSNILEPSVFLEQYPVELIQQYIIFLLNFSVTVVLYRDTYS